MGLDSVIKNMKGNIEIHEERIKEDREYITDRKEDIARYEKKIEESEECIKDLKLAIKILIANIK